MSLLEALLQLLPLDRLPRVGWLQAGIPQPESVAAHSFGSSLLALSLGPRVEPALDVDRAVSLALVHDTPEAWLSDLPQSATRCLPAGAKREAETRAAEGLLGPLSPLARERFLEFQAQETREARFARLCDKLHLGVRLVGYQRAGARGLEGFRESLERLECDGFEPCEGLRREILSALD